MNILSAKQLYEADKITTKKQGISSDDLMERAATLIYKWLHHRMQGAQVPVHIFCGIGNNGGDGLVLGRLLIESGYTVTIYIANFTDKRSKCFLINYGRVKKVTKKWPVLMTSKKDFPQIHKDDIIVDAIFGIGLNRAPEGWVKDLIQYLNEQNAFKLSIDIPSGLSANEPLLDGEAVIQANHTLTFQAPKLSFFLPETGKFVPYFEALDIGLDPDYLITTKPLAQLIMKPLARTFYKQREKYSYKGTYGHSLLVGGSKGKMGAIVLASRAALSAGSGLTTAFIPECGNTILQTAIPEAMALTDVNDDFISEIAFDFEPSAIGIGPGMGQEKQTIKTFLALLSQTNRPMVIDADAINIIATNPSAVKDVPKRSIFTPHPVELARLVGEWKNDYEKLEKAKAFSKDNEMIVVIKGANTITIFEDEMYINTSGNPGMATAGSGDVLTGIITGLLSQGYEPLVAATFGVYLHGSAGNIASEVKGFEALLANDLIGNLGKAYLELFVQDESQIKDGEDKSNV
ncbi:MAG: bifunctional ADP-dependent NAD(P)H-hydrate dehydratase/NAD(P)H-hydrate epimerase [Bacteroidetes bacterium]|nr:MAG: bifunctional ADP-dependent NAD(P)H-hydrate dehydratase/NAD(P)H-hydrate epimerase [Bacteroidota bacterium]